MRLQLNHALKKKPDQAYVQARLRLLDQQFSLDRHRHLWQSYVDLASEHRLWPVSDAPSIPYC